MMRKKLLTTLALLLMAISGAWADSYLYLEFSGTSATLKYGEVPTQCLYFLDGSVVGWEPNGYTESESGCNKRTVPLLHRPSVTIPVLSHRDYSLACPCEFCVRTQFLISVA